MVVYDKIFIIKLGAKMKIENFLVNYNSIALAYSGGVDSSYLLYECIKNKKKTRAYFVKTQFQPDFELNNAITFAKSIDADLRIIRANILSKSNIISNPANRCYHCKKFIFNTIIDASMKDGFEFIFDGTNASDKYEERPGMKALEELNIISPLKICKIDKNTIREKFKEYKLDISLLKSYSCLATRVPTGTFIDEDVLKKIESCEKILFEMGFSDFRVRYHDNFAKIELCENDFRKIIEKKEDILNLFSQYFKNVYIDLKSRI